MYRCPNYIIGAWPVTIAMLDSTDGRGWGDWGMDCQWLAGLVSRVCRLPVATAAVTVDFDLFFPNFLSLALCSLDRVKKVSPYCN